MGSFMEKKQTEKIKPTIEEGRKFLAQNKLKPGVKTTASGLQYEIITEGTGIKPTAVDTFVAHYRGTLLNGTEFDASYNRGQPLTLGLGQVVRGWTEGLQLMPVGSKFKFYIPYELGYGAMGNGPAIPGGSMLIFELELLDLKKKRLILYAKLPLIWIMWCRVPSIITFIPAMIIVSSDGLIRNFPSGSFIPMQLTPVLFQFSISPIDLPFKASGKSS